ncbi:MAG TPA: histidine kinase [Rhizobiales bacterium]|nr:histidine kinase [Hyphomicrobiales bacterium]
MPDSLRYLIILAVLGGIVYGGAWWLAKSPPGPVEIEKSISNDRLRG